MPKTTFCFIYAAEETDGYSPWDAKLAELNKRARKRVEVLKLRDGKAVVDDTYKISTIRGPLVPAGPKPPVPRVPVVWPRGITAEVAFAHVDEIAVMGQAAVIRDLDVYMSGAAGSDEKLHLAQVGGLVTTLRVGIAACMDVAPVNIDRTSKYTVTYDGEDLMLFASGANAAEQMQIRAHRATRKKSTSETSDRLPSMLKFALMGPFLLLIASLKRGMGPQAAVAAMYTKLFDAAAIRCLPAVYHGAFHAEWVRSALLEETWRAFPADLGDMIQGDFAAQEAVTRACLEDPADVASSVERVKEYIKVRTQPSSRQRNASHTAVQRIPVPEDVISFYGSDDDMADTVLGIKTPATEATRTPDLLLTRPHTPIRYAPSTASQTPLATYISPQLPPGAREQIVGTFAEPYAQQNFVQGNISPPLVGPIGSATPPRGGV